MNYNQDILGVADEYIVVNPEYFDEAIMKAAMTGLFDAVISCHNLEHCNYRDKVLSAMCESVGLGGKIFLSFPTSKSVKFPRRKGTLNYFEDHTHRDLPPDFDLVIQTLKSAGFRINYSARRYRPWLGFLFGLMQEPISILSGKKYSATWALYGFESIIWAEKTRINGAI
jgi:hypothetical protein